MRKTIMKAFRCGDISIRYCNNSLRLFIMFVFCEMCAFNFGNSSQEYFKN